jgi:hypothetical protein
MDADRARTVIGSSSRLTKLTGDNPRLSFARRYILFKANATEMIWEIKGDGLYEWQKFATKNHTTSSGFCVIDSATVRKVDRDEAIGLIRRGIYA